MQLDGYSDLEKLTTDGTGEVYRATKLSPDRMVVIRFLSPDYASDEQTRAVLERESQVIANLNHDNIIKVIDWGMTDKKQPYFVMDYVQGLDLEAIRAKKGLNFNVKGHLLMQVCRAMACAHHNGVVHLNLKPENILVDKQGRVRVLGFGLAWLEMAARHKHEGIRGTSDFTSPEQLSHPEVVSHLSDVYSLGVLMYQVFTGLLPAEHHEEPASGLKQLPSPLVDLIIQCLQIRPDDRPESADEVGSRLLKVLNGGHIRQIDREDARKAIGPAVDKFELLDIISRNQFGAVYLFKDKSRNIIFVVKKRVKTHAGLREASRLKAVHHNNIIRILNSSRHKYSFIVLMEYLRGGSLKDRLSRPYDLKAFLQVATDICSGMQRAHKEGILHGNLRPSNILFDKKGRARLSDFGYSKHYSDNLKRDWYQPQSRQNASVKRDIYSAGAIFYHMLTASPATISYGQITADKEFTRLNTSVQTLLRNMIEMQSLSRLKSFAEVLDALASIQAKNLASINQSVSRGFKWSYAAALLAAFGTAGLLALWFSI